MCDLCDEYEQTGQEKHTTTDQDMGKVQKRCRKGTDKHNVVDGANTDDCKTG